MGNRIRETRGEVGVDEKRPKPEPPRLLPYARPGTVNRVGRLSDDDGPFPADDPFLVLRMVIGVIALLWALFYILLALFD